MERLTNRTSDGMIYVVSETGNEGVGHFTTQRRLPELMQKVCEYEELEEQGMLLKLNAPIDIIIRCAMCTNIMRSDRGCDGGCQVDEIMFDRIMKEILKSELK